MLLQDALEPVPVLSLSGCQNLARTPIEPVCATAQGRILGMTVFDSFDCCIDSIADPTEAVDGDIACVLLVFYMEALQMILLLLSMFRVNADLQCGGDFTVWNRRTK